jgi:hypothetical protein
MHMLGAIVRTLSIQLDVFCQIWASRFVPNALERLKQIKKLKDRYSGMKETKERDEIKDFSLYT